MRYKNENLKNLITVLVILLVFMGCSSGNEPIDNAKNEAVFPRGEQTPIENFTGTVWLQSLIPDDSVYNLLSGSVTFESGARTHWHSHPSGQILLVIEGTGYHQIKGEPRQEIRKGDVVKCPPDVAHWHGAGPDSSMTHIHIIPNTENGIVEWMEPVTDEEYTGAE